MNAEVYTWQRTIQHYDVSPNQTTLMTKWEATPGHSSLFVQHIATANNLSRYHPTGVQCCGPQDAGLAGAVRLAERRQAAGEASPRGAARLPPRVRHRGGAGRRGAAQQHQPERARAVPGNSPDALSTLFPAAFNVMYVLSCTFSFVFNVYLRVSIVVSCEAKQRQVYALLRHVCVNVGFPLSQATLSHNHCASTRT